MKHILLICIAIAMNLTSFGQGFESPSILQSNYTTNYALYIPDNYNPDKATDYPLIVFLHGAGPDELPPSEIAANVVLTKKEYWPNYDAFVAVPACHQNVNWEPLVLNKMLGEILDAYRIDPDRVYLTGPSMGGYGTWRWASDNPELFAAAAPICGGGNPDKVWGMRNMPVWVSHGQDDDIVLCSESIRMVDALKAMGANPKFDIYPGVKHNAWDKIYYSTEFYDWLFSQKRQPMPSIEIPETEMDQYIGSYQLPWMGIININKIEGRLQIEMTLSGQKTDLLSDAPDRFYVAHTGSNMILFNKSSDGKIESIKLYGGDEPQIGKKIK